jgi:hypothetical protein
VSWDELRQAVRTEAKARSMTHAGVAAAIGKTPSYVLAALSMRRPASASLQTALRGWLNGNAPAPTPHSRPPVEGPEPHPPMCAPTAKNSNSPENVSASLPVLWEYRVVRLPDHDWPAQCAALDVYGAAGWDLVCVGGGVSYLRRVRVG